MFEHFALGMSAPSYDDDNAIIGSSGVSPGNISFPSPLPPGAAAAPSTAPRASITDLAAAAGDFGQDDISASYLPSPPLGFEHDLEVDEDSNDYDNDGMLLYANDMENRVCDGGDKTLKSKERVKTPSTKASLPFISLHYRRLQRQHNAQLRCNSATLRSIELLLEETAQAGEGRSVVPVTIVSAPPSASLSSFPFDPSTSPSSASPPSPRPAAPSSLATAITSIPQLQPQAMQASPPEPPLLPLPEDEGYCEGSRPDAEDEDPQLTEQMLLSLRRASTPRGVMKLVGPVAMRNWRLGLGTESLDTNEIVMRVPRVRRKITARRRPDGGAGR